MTIPNESDQEALERLKREGTAALRKLQSTIKKKTAEIVKEMLSPNEEEKS